MSKYFELGKVTPNEPLDTDFANLYPEIKLHGSLGRALEAELQSRGVTLAIEGFEKIGFPLHGATIQGPARSCQIMVAAKERCFSADFRERGVLLLKIQTMSFAVVVDAISVWCGQQGTIPAMQAISPDVAATPDAEAYEAGAGVMVERQWNSLMNSAPQGHRDLLPFLEEALKTPELRRLFPFTSLVHLCFSRCTGYPFTRDCPHVTPLASGRFRVSDANERTIGEGNAQEAVQFVVRNLPEGCSAAVHGTAEDV
jgi:hypothetical protein